VRVHARSPERKLMKVRLPQNDAPAFHQAVHHGRVVPGAVVAENSGSGSGAYIPEIEQILETDRDSVERPTVESARNLFRRLAGLRESQLARNRDEGVERRLQPLRLSIMDLVNSRGEISRRRMDGASRAMVND